MVFFFKLRHYQELAALFHQTIKNNIAIASRHFAIKTLRPFITGFMPFNHQLLPFNNYRLEKNASRHIFDSSLKESP